MRNMLLLGRTLLLLLYLAPVLVTAVDDESIAAATTGIARPKQSLRRKASIEDTIEENNNAKQQKQRQQQLPLPSSIQKEEDTYFKHLVKRMKPRYLQVNIDNDQNRMFQRAKGTSIGERIINHPQPKQFFHLHHMKTGGTSLSSYIDCAVSRYTALYNRYHKVNFDDNDDDDDYYNDNDDDEDEDEVKEKDTTTTVVTSEEKYKPLHFPSYRLSECSHNSYQNCISQSNHRCHSPISSASVMTYCAPLAATRHFNWNNDSYDTPSVTMLRHPVDRVWSMYRFQTRSCFQCKSLIDVYNDIDNGIKGGEGGYETGICLPQLSNHITRNLLTNLTIDQLDDEATSTMTEEEKVKDAIHSVKHRFTVVGIIERLEESLELFSFSFPWMTADILESTNYYDFMDLDSNTLLEEKYMKCEFPHDNSSPMNNRCGQSGQHLDLPPHPDEETRKAIERHNLLDIQVYEAALEHFEMQKRAMNWEEEEQLE